MAASSVDIPPERLVIWKAWKERKESMDVVSVSPMVMDVHPVLAREDILLFRELCSVDRIHNLLLDYLNLRLPIECTVPSFDDTSRAWRQNKILSTGVMGQKIVHYRCTYVHTKTQKRCPKAIFPKPDVAVPDLDDRPGGTTCSKQSFSDVFCQHHARRRFHPLVHLWS